MSPAILDKQRKPGILRTACALYAPDRFKRHCGLSFADSYYYDTVLEDSFQNRKITTEEGLKLRACFYHFSLHQLPALPVDVTPGFLPTFGTCSSIIATGGVDTNIIFGKVFDKSEETLLLTTTFAHTNAANQRYMHLIPIDLGKPAIDQLYERIIRTSAATMANIDITPTDNGFINRTTFSDSNRHPISRYTFVPNTNILYGWGTIDTRGPTFYTLNPRT